NVVVGSGEWGIDFDSGDVGDGFVSPVNVAAFNTLYANGATGAHGGIRFHRASGEIRDNLVVASSGIGIKTDSQPTYVHHNGLFANPRQIDFEGASPPEIWSNVEQDPLLVDPNNGDFRLQHTATGHAADSPMKD